MNRPLTAVFSALEALLVVGVGLGLTLVPLSLLWAFEYGLQIDWIVFWRVAANTWLLGHGVDVLVELDPLLALSIGLPAAGEPFELGIAALGFALLTVLLAARAGRRIAETEHRILGIITALTVTAGLAALVAFSAGGGGVRPSLAQGVLLPTAVFALGLVWGAEVTRSRLRRVRPEEPGRIRAIAERIPEHVRVMTATALRAGGGAVASLLAVSAALWAVFIAVSYAELITLYEGVHAGVLGGIALTIAQLALTPNLVIWGAAWLVGPGFAIGTGSWVGPLGTQLGLVPAVPVLGALPTGPLPWGFAGLAVPVVAGFLAAVLVKGRLARLLGARFTIGVRALCGVAIGVAGGAVLGALALASGGAAGPGRLADVGPDALLVAGWAALELGLPAVLALVTRAEVVVPERVEAHLAG